MVTTEGRTIRQSRIEQRFIWMLLNYERWKDFPPRPKWNPGDYAGWSKWLHSYGNQLLRWMKEDGIISQKTDVCCVPNIDDMIEIIKTGDKAGYYKYLGHL